MAAIEMDDRGVIVACASCGQKNRLTYERLDDEVRCGQCKQPLKAPGAPIEIHTTADFDRLVSRSSVPVVVDYWAPWCGPCRMVAPVVEELAKDLAGRVRVAKLNVDENPATASRFHVQSIPTLLVLKGGKEMERIVGAQPKAKIAQRLERVMR
jgi:thioredoxin 2